MRNPQQEERASGRRPLTDFTCPAACHELSARRIDIDANRGKAKQVLTVRSFAARLLPMPLRVRTDLPCLAAKWSRRISRRRDKRRSRKQDGLRSTSNPSSFLHRLLLISGFDDCSDITQLRMFSIGYRVSRSRPFRGGSDHDCRRGVQGDALLGMHRLQPHLPL